MILLVVLFAQMMPLQKLAFEKGLTVRVAPHSGRITLSDGKRKVVLALGSEMALFDGKVIRLSQAARRDIEGIVVPKEVALFFKQVGHHKKRRRRKRKFVIVLDAGHGGRFTGAVANGLAEKDINLDVVLRVWRLLKNEEDMKLILTRRTDMELDMNWSRDLDARVDVANRADADLFVSVHFNATAKHRTDVSGIEVYVAREEEDVTRRVSRALREAGGTLTRLGELADSPASDTAWILHRILLEEKFRRSLEAARCFVQALRKNNEDFVRGIFARGYRVVKWTRCPAVLLELGYITHPATAQRLKNSRYRQKLAELVAEGIKEYIKRLRAEEEPQKPQHRHSPSPSTKEEGR